MMGSSLVNDAKERKDIHITRSYDYKDIAEFKVTFKQLFEQLNTQISIVQRDLSSSPELLSCDNFHPSYHVMSISNWKEMYWYNMTCTKVQNYLQIGFNLTRNIDEYNSFVSQDDLVYVQISTIDPNFSTDNFYVFFQSDSFFFNGNYMQKNDFITLPMRFKNQHVINLGTTIVKTTESLWQLDSDFEKQQTFYTMRDPTYNYNQFQDNTLQMAFSFNRFFQNQPTETIFLQPASYFAALSKLGGHLSIISLLAIILGMYHKISFEKELNIKLQEKMQDLQDQNSPDKTVKNTEIVQDIISFERLLEIGVKQQNNTTKHDQEDGNDMKNANGQSKKHGQSNNGNYHLLNFEIEPQQK
eukprot:403334580